jgi:hypothetical protein
MILLRREDDFARTFVREIALDASDATKRFSQLEYKECTDSAGARRSPCVYAVTDLPPPSAHHC